ncbi:type II toxin-antitoxin system prevent-host-death family antitoxin [Eubacteriaceae bacterium ES3]|nr:type II toxin-antitoxin system prevent-host-death family antitoxin [Eubacteriaceae bacterium ES3]
MIVRSRSMLLADYEKISKLARTSGEPVYITKNGENDTVLMSIEAFEKREEVIKELYKMKNRKT